MLLLSQVSLPNSYGCNKVLVNQAKKIHEYLTVLPTEAAWRKHSENLPRRTLSEKCQGIIPQGEPESGCQTYIWGGPHPSDLAVQFSGLSFVCTNVHGVQVASRKAL
jgi:hypothetical protein